MAREEYAALRQQREAQRQVDADCRHVALMAVCEAAALPDIREDLRLRRQPADGTPNGVHIMLICAAHISLPDQHARHRIVLCV